MDIIFFVDGSNSLQRESFNLGKQVVTNFIEEHGVESYRYSVLQISSNVTEEISLGQYSTSQQYIDAINNIRFYQGGTMTSEAIRYMVEHTLQNRPVYNTKAIVITDGAAQDVVNLKTASDLAKSKGVEMYAIGVEIPDQIKQKCLGELKTIASRPKRDHAYLVKDYTKLLNKTTLWNNVQCSDSPCTCKEGYVLTQNRKRCVLRQDPIVPNIVDLEVVTTIGSFNISAKWQLVGVTEFYEKIDYYYVTISKFEHGRRTNIYWLKTKETFFATNYFLKEVTFNCHYLIEVYGRTTKGHITNKVSQTFEFVDEPSTVGCTCEQQNKNHNEVVRKIDDMTLMLRQVLTRFQQLQHKVNYLESESSRNRKGTKN